MKRTAKLLVCLGLVWGASAQAASVTYLLNQSNELLDGPTYLKVTITDNGANVDFKVETTAAFTPGGNFGIQAFGFNPNAGLAITSANISGLATGWSVSTNQNANALDGFGKFKIAEAGTGSTRQDPLTFSIINVAGDSSSTYANPSSGTAGSWVGTTNPFFAAHVAGFAPTQGVSGTVTSAYFAGSTAVPVPAAAWLLGSGLIGLVGVARRKPV